MMWRKKIAGYLLTVALSAAAGVPAFAERQNAPNPKPQARQSAPPVRQAPRPAPSQGSRPQSAPRQSPPPSNGARQRPESRESMPGARRDRAYSGPSNSGAGNSERARNYNRADSGFDRGRQSSRSDRPNPNRPYGNSGSSVMNPNRPNAERPSWNRDTNSTNPNRPPSSQYSGGGSNYGGYGSSQQLSLEERQRVRQNEQRFRQLSPAQQQDMRERGRVWQQMTPEQRNHITNEVLPAWKQLPAQRQKAIQQRLGVLKNMPESARNQHLNDPNFTRGLTEEDRATLRDLSHLHVGGAPDAPNE